MAERIEGEPQIKESHGSAFFDEPETPEALARRQGVKPLNFEELMAMEETWPEEESVDDFIAALREWRNEGTDRSLP